MLNRVHRGLFGAFATALLVAASASSAIAQAKPAQAKPTKTAKANVPAAERPPALRAPTSPIVVADAETGQVIYSQAATDPWFPASITKLMTTYVALDLIRQGKAAPDTMLTISDAAAAEPPSKMYFKPGTQVRLDQALKMIMVKSANDVAHAIGENLGGTVEGFADMMNETARRIGMNESRWYNPHGLPEPRQWTTARDMAILARAMMRDFPQEHALFSIQSIQYGQSVLNNHNGLIGRYAGADGMKTGFICAGGFNVVASATRGGRRVVAVVMGQSSARERDLKAADLFDYGFGRAAGGSGATLQSLAQSSIGTPPDIRPFACGKQKSAPVDEGQGAITAAGTPGNDNAKAQLVGLAATSSPQVAFSFLNSTAVRGRSLPPRAPAEPVQVFAGRSAEEGAMIIARDEAEVQAQKTAKVDAARARREAAAEAARLAKADKAARQRAAAVAAPTTKVIADTPKVPKAATAFAPTGGSESPSAVKAPTRSVAKTAPAPKVAPAPKSAKPSDAKPAAKKTAGRTGETAAR